MNRIKRFFQVETKSTKFGGVLLEYLILYIIIGAIVGLSFLIPNKYIFVGIIGICSLSFFYSLWLLVLKLFVISDNRHNEKIKAKNILLVLDRCLYSWRILNTLLIMPQKVKKQ